MVQISMHTDKVFVKVNCRCCKLVKSLLSFWIPSYRKRNLKEVPLRYIQFVQEPSLLEKISQKSFSISSPKVYKK